LFRTRLRAVQDRVAAIQTERVLELIEPLAGCLVAAVDDPAVGLQQRGGTQETVRVPPIARARRRATSAQDAPGRRVDLLLIFLRLEPLAIRGRRSVGLEPRLHSRVL